MLGATLALQTYLVIQHLVFRRDSIEAVSLITAIKTVDHTIVTLLITIKSPRKS